MILSSCTNNRLKVDISNTHVEQDFYYVDDLLHKLSLNELKKKHLKLSSSLDQLYVFEWQENLRTKASDSLYKEIHDFYQSEYIHDLETAKTSLLPQVKEKEEGINTAFRYFNHHFENSPFPQQIIFMNKLFSTIHCSDSAVTVALESYISPENEVIKSIPNDQLYEWQRERMDIQYLERDLLLSWIQVQLFNEIDKQLAQHIVQAGKILYVLNATFPDAEEQYILRYNEKDWNWAVENEQLTWDYLVKEQLLFKNNRRDKANFLNEGPTSVGLPEESPDRMGQYLGYKMVKGFMQENKQVSLQNLLNIDYNKILQSYEID
jgi:hypothetical protein